MTPKREAVVYAKASAKRGLVTIVCEDHAALRTAMDAATAAWPDSTADVRAGSHTAYVTVERRGHVGGGALAHQIKSLAVPRARDAAKSMLQALGFKVRRAFSCDEPIEATMTPNDPNAPIFPPVILVGERLHTPLAGRVYTTVAELPPIPTPPTFTARTRMERFARGMAILAEHEPDATAFATASHLHIHVASRGSAAMVAQLAALGWSYDDFVWAFPVPTT